MRRVGVISRLLYLRNFCLDFGGEIVKFRKVLSVNRLLRFFRFFFLWERSIFRLDKL